MDRGLESDTMREPLPITIHLGAILLMVSDLLVLAGSVATLALVWHAGDSGLAIYLRMLFLVPAVLLIYGGAGLYQGAVVFPGAALGPAEELRRLTYATLATFLASMTFCFFDQRPGIGYSHHVLAAAGLAWLVLIPAARFCLRLLLRLVNQWGIPAVVVGDDDLAKRVMSTLAAHPEYGINAVGYVAETACLPGFRHLGTPDQLLEIARQLGISYGIFIVRNNDEQAQAAVARHHDHFRHLLIVQESRFSSAAWIQPKDLGGILGLEVHQNLLFPGLRLLKAVGDYLLALVLSLLTLPLLLCLALLVKLDSRGPVFFTQDRVGRGGRIFRICKFRTMRHGAETAFNQLLDQDASLKGEWETVYKIKDDPRVTWFGSLLRKTSLDELPQLWNILRGEMALVGPRPITLREIPRYGEHLELYQKVLPGLTGLWQVSGRSELSYEERIMLDARYINNWSPWLDLYILLKTFDAVLFRKGAV